MRLNIYHSVKIWFSILFILWTFASNAEEIRVVTSEEPLVMYLENGKPSGIGTEVVQAVLTRSELPFSIGVYPWARAYHMAESQENILIYPIARTPEREHLFSWVGKIIPPVKAWFFKRAGRNDVTLTKFEDAKYYNIGVTRNGSFHQFLLSQEGFEENKNVFPVRKMDQNIKKLLSDRIDLFCYVDISVIAEMKKLGISINELEPVLKVKDINAYMAFSKNTPNAIVKKVQRAYSELKADGTIDAIFEKYLKMIN